MEIYGYKLYGKKSVIRYILYNGTFGLTWTCLGPSIKASSIRDVQAYIRTLNGFIIEDLDCVDLTKLKMCCEFHKRSK